MQDNQPQEIKIEFTDLFEIINSKGTYHKYSSEVKGKDSGLDVVKNMIASQNNLSNIHSIFVNFKLNEMYPLLDISEAIEEFYNVVDEDIDLVWGTSVDNELAVDEVKLSLIAFFKINGRKKPYIFN